MPVYDWLQYMDLLCVTRSIPKSVTFRQGRAVTPGVSGAVDMMHIVIV